MDMSFGDPRSLIGRILDHMFLIESDMRQTATELQLNPEESAVRADEALSHAYKTVSDVLLEDLDQLLRYYNVYSVDGFDLVKLRRFLELYRDAVAELRRSIDIFGPGTQRVVRNKDVVEKLLNDLENLCVELAGVRCRFRAGDSLPSYLNDLASCMHRVAEAFAEKWANAEQSFFYVVISPGRGEKLARLWAKAVYKASEDGLYHAEDAGVQFAWVTGDAVYLKLGSAAGHRTYVDFATGKLEYYDTDIDVNYVVAMLLTDLAKMKCEATKMGVFCEGASEIYAPEIASVLALAISMDYRLGRPEEFWGEFVKLTEDKVTKLKAEMRPVILKWMQRLGLTAEDDYIFDEYVRCRWYIENVLLPMLRQEYSVSIETKTAKQEKPETKKEAKEAPKQRATVTI